MYTQRQAYLQKAFLSAVAVLLLPTTAGQSTNKPQTTETTPSSNVSLTTQLSNSSMEEPVILRLYRSCGSEHKDYCKNSGQCIYPQDSEAPFCICTSSYMGPRCFFLAEHTHSGQDLEKVIGITFGVLMLFIVLAIIFYFFVYKGCMKSTALIKPAPSDMSA